MSNDDQSIRGLFSKAERIREELAASYEPNSPTYQENLENAIATYVQCLKKADDFSLFSPNETLEDISSSDIQYVSGIEFLFAAQLTVVPDTCPLITTWRNSYKRSSLQRYQHEKSKFCNQERDMNFS